MAETSEATGAAAQGSKKDLAEAAGGEKVIKVAIDGMGWHILKLLDFEMVIYPESKIAKGRFVVKASSWQPFGVLQAGTTGYVADAIASLMTSYTSQFQRVATVEHNVNHLRPVPVGREILVTASPLLFGKRFQVWDVRFETEKAKPPGSDSKTPELVLVAISRMSIMLLPTDQEFTPKRGVNDTFGGVTFMET